MLTKISYSNTYLSFSNRIYKVNIPESDIISQSYSFSQNARLNRSKM
ncbi:putative dipeptidase pepE [Gossypium arboreum]|uniref:Putative dipeptidase pepE n=1 Tax=Gossypium arboreum TaxID=29729 RepID=A0A0B0PRP8_GOSAR|nr:putative dipeptidase pepE [Gossypium arboreum]